MEDGNIYGYPCSATTLQDYEEKKESMASNQTFVVRKDIYEAIGSPDMSTQEGFLEAVEKAVEMFPEVNGEKLIPVGAHVFDNEGNLNFRTSAKEDDLLFDEIGSVLKVKQQQAQKRELLEGLETYYKVRYLGLPLEDSGE